MRFVHRTPRETAEAILARGFRDGEGFYLTADVRKGVWLSDVPVDSQRGWVTLEVETDLTEADLAKYEWVDEGNYYREWLVPASLINARMRVRLQPPDPDSAESG